MILFVDDEHSGLGADVWLQALTDAGYRCLPTGNPDDALDLLRSRPEIAGAIIDIMLPVGSLNFEKAEGGLEAGLVLIEEFHKIRPELPIVILSLRRDLSKKVAKLGAEFVSKTLDDPEDLVEIISRLVPLKKD